MTEFAQYLIDGLGNGTLYAMIAVGFTLIFGVMGLMNVAHADLYMLSAFTLYWVSGRDGGLGLGVLTGVGVAILGSVVLALVMFQLVLRRLDKSNVLALFVATLGVSFFLENLVAKLSGSQVRSVPTILGSQTHVVFGVRLSNGVVASVLVASTLTVALLVFMRSSDTGRSMRAVAESPILAESVGIDGTRVTMLAVVIASVVAAVGGLLNANVTASADPFVANTVSLRMFAVAVVAGIGSLGGAFIIGIVLGVAESLTIWAGVQIGFDGSSWASVIGLLMMVVVLLVRPQGLFGHAKRIG